MGSLTVDPAQRYAKTRAHTATHILHHYLQDFFPTTHQAGSLVESDYLRFDFGADRLLSSDEIRHLENSINAAIRDSHPIDIRQMNYDDAVAQGARAFFADKYDDVVRVVTIAAIGSRELCGGTHVNHTGEIGACVIVGHESVASGVKRITALTGPRVVDHIHQMHADYQPLYNYYQTDHIPTLIQKIQKDHTMTSELSSNYAALQTRYLMSLLQHAPRHSGAITIILTQEDLSPLSFKEVAPLLRAYPASVLLYHEDGQFVLAGTESFDAKARASQNKLRGGGSPLLFQGKDPSIIDLVQSLS